ncbi:hypothetical protein Q5752_001912 [Cryptotrichosporon argae]
MTADVAELGKAAYQGGVEGGYWGCTYRVASVWPYKLVTGLLDRAAKMATGWVNIQTRAPVASIEYTPNG